MSQYTQEKWSARGDVVYLGKEGGFSLQYAPHSIGNAARIVACVNFCSGISTKNLTDNYPLTWLLNKKEEDQRLSLELRQALVKYEQAFDELFAHCCSNGVFNAWGKQVNCTTLNEAHQLAGDLLSSIINNDNI